MVNKDKLGREIAYTCHGDEADSDNGVSDSEDKTKILKMGYSSPFYDQQELLTLN